MQYSCKLYGNALCWRLRPGNSLCLTWEWASWTQIQLFSKGMLHQSDLNFITNFSATSIVLVWWSSVPDLSGYRNGSASHNYSRITREARGMLSYLLGIAEYRLALPSSGGGDFKGRFKVFLKNLVHGKCQPATLREKSPKICISEALAQLEIFFQWHFLYLGPVWYSSQFFF